ncbi:MAG: sulfur carrier protein ThiS [Acidimicrobiia bacterium]|nr:sulfur carrier protein ThiS [Acidimicrobiia bacterium]MYC57765.1 sulfur carrier protein ThiS [Acidimicrobiia bacterium]MYG93448.1 sulfur carrier protein ThiS [Acidimicrobiia bacterium]MYI31314.1 sulfur carrier protein ThiS [Acidimicrobiia bacterium]
MLIVFNGRNHNVPENYTVSALAPNQRGVAVSVNRQIVPRSQWPLTRLCDGDHVEILEAAQGG